MNLSPVKSVWNTFKDLEIYACLKISELRSFSLGWLKKKTPQRPSFEKKKDILQQIEMLVCLLSNSHFLMGSNNWNPLILKIITVSKGYKQNST